MMEDEQIQPSSIELQCTACGRRLWRDRVTGNEQQEPATCECGNVRLRRTGRFMSQDLTTTRYKQVIRDSLPDLVSPMATVQHSLWLPE